MSGPCTLLVRKNPGDKSLVVTGKDNAERIFKVKSCNTTLHCKRKVFEVRNGEEYQLFLLQKQIATLHARCDGYSTSNNDFENFGKKLLTMSKNKVLQRHTKLKVKLFRKFQDKLDDFSYTNFSLDNENEPLITNKLETGCMIIGSWSEKNLAIYKAKSSTVIAKVLPLNTNDIFKVDVSSDVDCAFVVSLIAAVDCLKDPGTLKPVGKAVGFVLKATITACVSTAIEYAFN